MNFVALALLVAMTATTVGLAIGAARRSSRAVKMTSFTSAILVVASLVTLFIPYSNEYGERCDILPTTQVLTRNIGYVEVRNESEQWLAKSRSYCVSDARKRTLGASVVIIAGAGVVAVLARRKTSR